ncbi:Peroxidase [Melia azedarach]|uniref:Peroxidase n=1 Tax=Melia azedarach TaxID=155640 RepID=A0ACC1XHF7_MELAZ|nr:Peroxidase [Melia azedarach]
MLLLSVISSQCRAQLSSTFYDTTCPNALNTIRTGIRTAISRERRMAASLIRLHFHDCFVQGCDASILLDDSSSIDSEKNAINNFRSVRGYEVIDRIKSQLEGICPGVVSCADIVSVAARDASFAVAFEIALIGLNARDMVALSGSHTIGQAQCVTFRERIYNNQSAIDAGFASTRRRRCPATGGNANLAPLDLVTPNSFDNNYFKNLIRRKGLLESDQVLFNGGSTDSIVDEYSKNPSKFKSDFAAAMIKMGDINPLTGSAGQIRKVCNIVN